MSRGCLVGGWQILEGNGDTRLVPGVVRIPPENPAALSALDGSGIELRNHGARAAPPKDNITVQLGAGVDVVGSAVDNLDRVVSTSVGLDRQVLCVGPVRTTDGVGSEHVLVIVKRHCKTRRQHGSRNPFWAKPMGPLTSHILSVFCVGRGVADVGDTYDILSTFFQYDRYTAQNLTINVNQLDTAYPRAVRKERRRRGRVTARKGSGVSQRQSGCEEEELGEHGGLLDFCRWMSGRDRWGRTPLCSRSVFGNAEADAKLVSHCAAKSPWS